MDQLVIVLLVAAVGVLVAGVVQRERARDRARPQGRWAWDGTGWVWVVAPPGAGVANRAAAKALGLVLVSCALTGVLVGVLWMLYRAGAA